MRPRTADTTPSTLYYMLSGGSTSAPVVPVKPRGPLPPFDPATFESADDRIPPTWHPVYTELKTTPLPLADARWFRGDAWAVTVDGLPYVDGGASGPAQSRVLTYFLDRYGAQWEDRILRAHLERGYRHFSLSPQDSFAHGQSFDEYVAMAVRVRQAGFHVHHLLRSKYYTGASGTTFDTSTTTRFPRAGGHLDDYKPIWRPHVSQRGTFAVGEPDRLVDALLSAGAGQMFTPAWEMNFWSPTVCRALIDHDAARIGTAALIELHFFPHYISWQQPNESPSDFWNQNVGKVDGVLYQCQPFWSAGMMAARMTDSVDRLAPGGIWGLGDSGRGHPFDVVGWELIATQQYGNGVDGNGNLADEDHGNLKGFELLCAPGRMAVMGFGNGARYPDGSAL